jgi:hypothetical protein
VRYDTTYEEAKSGLEARGWLRACGKKQRQHTRAANSTRPSRNRRTTTSRSLSHLFKRDFLPKVGHAQEFFNPERLPRHLQRKLNVLYGLRFDEALEIQRGRTEAM